MSSDPGRIGHEPDDMGDDEQESEVSEYEYYLEDPPDDLVIAEDGDDDAEAAADWAARHPRAATAPDVPDDVSAEESAMHETRGE
jgi:hypothetical protein